MSKLCRFRCLPQTAGGGCLGIRPQQRSELTRPDGLGTPSRVAVMFEQLLPRRDHMLARIATCCSAWSTYPSRTKRCARVAEHANALRAVGKCRRVQKCRPALRTARCRPTRRTLCSTRGIYGDEVTAMKQPDRFGTLYVLQFSESMRGLSVGAPVMLLGLPAGTVTEVEFDVDPITKFGRSLVRELITDPTVESAVATHSRAMARVCADLATAIRVP